MATFRKDDQIYISYPRQLSEYEFDTAVPTKPDDEHMIWHRPHGTGRQDSLKRGIDYRKIKITKDGITIETHGQRVKAQYQEHGKGMVQGKVTDTDPL
jgi:hypothetical protein